MENEGCSLFIILLVAIFVFYKGCISDDEFISGGWYDNEEKSELCRDVARNYASDYAVEWYRANQNVLCEEWMNNNDYEVCEAAANKNYWR